MKLSTGISITHIPDLSKITDEQKQHCKDWIAALRSGEYKQAQEVLRASEGFCCLGVACDLRVKAGLAAWGKPSHTGGFPLKDHGDTVFPYLVDLSPETRFYYGMPRQYGFEVQVQGLGPRNLAGLNDGFGLPFTDIALVIETAINGGLTEIIPSTTKETV